MFCIAIGLKASRSHDYILSLLGLVREHDLVPDYKQDIGHLLRQVVRTAINQTKTLGILALAGRHLKGAYKIMDLPSWVPQPFFDVDTTFIQAKHVTQPHGRTTAKETGDALIWRFVMNASGPRLAENFKIEDDKMHVKGLRFNTIIKVFAMRRGDDFDRDEQITILWEQMLTYTFNTIPELHDEHLFDFAYSFTSALTSNVSAQSSRDVDGSKHELLQDFWAFLSVKYRSRNSDRVWAQGTFLELM